MDSTRGSRVQQQDFIAIVFEAKVMRMSLLRLEDVIIDVNDVFLNCGTVWNA